MNGGEKKGEREKKKGNKAKSIAAQSMLIFFERSKIPLLPFKFFMILYPKGKKIL